MKLKETPLLKNHRRSFSKNLKGPWILFFALLFVVQTQAQNLCLKEIEYVILEVQEHALPEGIDLDELNTMDFLLGKSDSKITKVNICIDHEGYATTSNEITQNVNTPNPSNISKVVTSKFGTVAFDEDGEEILRLDLNQEMDEVPGIGMALTEDQINRYGLGIDLNSTTQFYASSIAEENSGQSWNEGDKFFFSI